MLQNIFSYFLGIQLAEEVWYLQQVQSALVVADCWAKSQGTNCQRQLADYICRLGDMIQFNSLSYYNYQDLLATLGNSHLAFSFNALLFCVVRFRGCVAHLRVHWVFTLGSGLCFTVNLFQILLFDLACYMDTYCSLASLTSA